MFVSHYIPPDPYEFEMPPEVGGDTEGHWKLLPERSMSRIRVSMGVFPTRRTKKSCSITEEDTVRREGSLSKSFPNLVGWLGY